VNDFNDNINILGPTVYWYNNKNKIQSTGIKTTHVQNKHIL
jgi:hypothetical protein